MAFMKVNKDDLNAIINNFENLDKAATSLLKIAIWDGPNYKLIDYLLKSEDFGMKFKAIVQDPKSKIFDTIFSVDG